MDSAFFRRSRISSSWLFNPPLHGFRAAALTAAAVAIPTVIRLSMAPQIDDQACTIFCPFVLMIVVLCGWRFALVAAIGSAVACNTVLMGAPYSFHFQRSEIEGLSTFLGYSALVISVVQLFRVAAARSLRQAGAKERESGVVFSIDGGQAWASWYGVDAPVRLGRPHEVVEMMEDFIAQVRLAERLHNRTARHPVD